MILRLKLAAACVKAPWHVTTAFAFLNTDSKSKKVGWLIKKIFSFIL